MASETKVTATATVADTETSLGYASGFTKGRLRNLSGNDILWSRSAGGSTTNPNCVPAGQVHIIDLAPKGGTIYFASKVINSKVELHCLP